jgi:NAD+ kinase
VSRFGLVVNTRITEAVSGSYDIINYLKDKTELIITEELYNKIKNDADLDNVSTVPLSEFNSKNLDILITIGGDGTILRALHNCNIKIFGINAGVVGFLTEVHLQSAVGSLKRLLDSDFELDERIRLQPKLNDQVLEPATNEAVIHTADIAKMRLYQIQLNGVPVQSMRADGIIISTPTGSTSYSMSAGGPILDPKVDAFIIVPLAPFTLSARPLVVPSNSEITVKLMEPQRNSILVIDGQVEYQITPDDIVKFMAAETSAKFVRFEPHFYRLIEEKLTK